MVALKWAKAYFKRWHRSPRAALGWRNQAFVPVPQTPAKCLTLPPRLQALARISTEWLFKPHAKPCKTVYKAIWLMFTAAHRTPYYLKAAKSSGQILDCLGTRQSNQPMKRVSRSQPLGFTKHQISPGIGSRAKVAHSCISPMARRSLKL